MYEIDFTGWTRTPEALEELKANSCKRRLFHIRRLVLSIRYKHWYKVIPNLKASINNTKTI